MEPDRNTVNIAAVAVRDRHTGHVFAAAIMTWPAGNREQVFVRDIIPGIIDNDTQYINVAGGLAHIVDQAMEHLTRRCTVRVHVDVEPGDFIRFLELATGVRKATVAEAKAMKELRRTREVFEKLAHSIEQHVVRAPNSFTIAMSPEADGLLEVRSYASSYRDGWQEHAHKIAVASPSRLSPSP